MALFKKSKKAAAKQPAKKAVAKSTGAKGKPVGKAATKQQKGKVITKSNSPIKAKGAAVKKVVVSKAKKLAEPVKKAIASKTKALEKPVKKAVQAVKKKVKRLPLLKRGPKGEELLTKLDAHQDQHLIPAKGEQHEISKEASKQVEKTFQHNQQIAYQQEQQRMKNLVNRKGGNRRLISPRQS
ncbi:MAG: hypothetical protein U0V74_12360 [Chitinophagales bacterium]